MTKAEEYFTSLASAVPDLVPGKMFGALCLKAPNGKSAAMMWKDSIVVKLKDHDLSQASHLPGIQPFEPMEGKPMKEWVQIPFTLKDHWKKYLLISLQNV